MEDIISLHSSTAAEKDDERMALKIRTRAEDIPDVFILCQLPI